MAKESPRTLFDRFLSLRSLAQQRLKSDTVFLVASKAGITKGASCSVRNLTVRSLGGSCLSAFFNINLSSRCACSVLVSLISVRVSKGIQFSPSPNDDDGDDEDDCIVVVVDVIVVGTMK